MFLEQEAQLLMAAQAGAMDDLFDRHPGFGQQAFGTAEAAELDFLQHAAPQGFGEAAFQGAAQDAGLRHHLGDVNEGMTVIPDELNRPVDDFVRAMPGGDLRRATLPHEVGEQSRTARNLLSAGGP